LARLVVLIPVVAGVARLRSRGAAALEEGRWVALAAASGLATIATKCHAGHGTALRALPLRAVHVTGVSVWAGGLAVLGAVALDPPAEGIGAIVRRFAAIAPVGAVAGIAAGAVLALDVAPSPSAWTSTGYGHVLLLKVAAVAVLAVVASQTHRWVREPGGSSRLLRGLVSTEVALAALVLVFAAVLAGRNPYT
jgi:copper transport protein